MPATLQLGFSDFEKTYAKNRTPRQRFLQKMEATIHREAFLALIQPIDHQPAGHQGWGRPPFPMEIMLLFPCWSSRSPSRTH